MRAMTCRGAMLVTLLLVATAASIHGERVRGNLADRFQRARALSSGPIASFIEDEEVQNINAPEQEIEEKVDLTEDEEKQTTNAPEQEIEEIVDTEDPKVKTRPKPKNSLMQRTRDKMNRRRAQSRYGSDNRPRNGVRPTRVRLTPRPRTTTALPPRRRYTPRWRQFHRKTTSTSTLEPINISTEPLSSTTTAQTSTSTTNLELINISIESQSRIPATQTTTSTTTLQPITKSTKPQASILTTKSTTLATTQRIIPTTEFDYTYPPEIAKAITLTTPSDSQSSTTTLTPRRRFIPRWRRTTTPNPKTTTTSTTTLQPITKSTEKTSTESDYTYPTEISETITLTTLEDSQSSTTTLTPRRKFIPRRRNTTTANLKTSATSTTILKPITKSAELRSTESDYTYPTEIPEDVTYTTPVDSQSSTTTLTPRRRFIPRRRSTTTTNPITTTISTTTLQPITKSTESRSTESDYTYPTEITEDITYTTPAESQSSTTPLTPKLGYIPLWRRTTTANLMTTNTSITTLQPITKSTEPRSTEPDYTYPTEITEDITYTTPADTQSTLNRISINTDDSLTTSTTTTTTTTERSTTSTPFPTTEAISQEIETTEEFGHAGKVIPVKEEEIPTTEKSGHAGELWLVPEEDVPYLKHPKPVTKPLKKTFIPKPTIVGSGLFVGAGVNVEDPEYDLEQVGPVLILNNNLRKRRQHLGGENVADETDSPATVQPVETTINPFNDGFDDNDFETTLGPFSFNRRRSSTAPPTTLNESLQNLSDASDTTIEANSDPENNLVREVASGGSSPDFQEITVGTKVNLGGPGRRPVTGEVIPVELGIKSEFEKEHRTEGEGGIVLNSENGDSQSTSVSGKPERPGSSGSLSLLGSLFGSIGSYFGTERPKRTERPNIPNRPRPDRPQVLPERPSTRPAERTEFRPFRPRPSPFGNRPDILPPRLSSRPNIPESNSDSTTNRPVDSTIFPEDSLGDGVQSRSTAVPLRVSTFRPRPTGLLNKPSRPSSLLPSKPIIESGFQGIPGENGESRPAGLFRPGAEEPNHDYDVFDDYDADALPPSLPNLRIIPFVAADALTHQQGGNIDSFTGEDLRISSKDTAVTTTARPVTTERSTRRPLPAIGTRRPPILPPRGNRPRPSPFRQRPPRPVGTRPSFLPSRTTSKGKITSEENRIAPSTSSPFRLRFTPQSTTQKSFTPFTLATVEITTELVRSEPEVEITTDDFPSTESITVNTPSVPPRLPGPIVTTKNPFEVNTPEEPPRLPAPVISTKTPLEINTPEAPLRLPGPIRPIIRKSQESSVSSSSSKPIKTDDILNLFLQDKRGNPEGTTRVPPQFIPASNKPVNIKKTTAPMPVIPDAITNLFPLAPDPIVAQGLLKLSGCNIYGRMYQVDDRIKELSAECKECRCTPVGVQCLPVCA